MRSLERCSYSLWKPPLWVNDNVSLLNHTVLNEIHNYEIVVRVRPEISTFLHPSVFVFADLDESLRCGLDSLHVEGACSCSIDR
jgi:hypothetical protein